MKKNIHTSYGEISFKLEHQDFLILEKPAGLACHGPSKENLAHRLSLNGIEPLLCHRLDKSTSGLIIVAKNSEVAERFRLLFSKNKIEKYYLALTDKKGKKKQGSIKGHLKKGRNGNWLFESGRQPNGSTQFFSFGSSKNTLATRLLLLRLIGGKTHQIRVAMKSNSSPILGDNRYGGGEAERMMLHAYWIEFDYQGKHIKASCLPDFITPFQYEDLTEALANPGLQPWPKS